MDSALRKWLPALAPALVFALLAVQVLAGLRGFDRPHEGPLRLLQFPGSLLGWGSVPLLLPLLAWLVRGWLGRPVGNLAIAALGAATMGLAVGGLCGLATGAPGVAAGGRIGGALAGLLGASMPALLAGAVLVVMALAGALLALTRLHAAPAADTSAAAPTPAAAPAASPAATSAAKGKGSLPTATAPRPVRSTARSPYPERRYDADGNELPMDLGGSDTGTIRFRDDPPETPAGSAAQEGATSSAAQPAGTRWPSGLVGDDEGASAAGKGSTTSTTFSGSALPGAVNRNYARQGFPTNPGDANLMPGVRYRDEEPAPAAAPAPASSTAPPTPAPAPRAAPAAAAPAAAPAAPTPAPASKPGARTPPAAAPAPEAAAAPAPASAPTPAAARETPPPSATRKPAREPKAASTTSGATPLGPPVVPFERSGPAPDESEAVSRAVGSLGDASATEGYRQKLAASGIFDDTQQATPPAAAPSPAEPKARKPRERKPGEPAAPAEAPAPQAAAPARAAAPGPKPAAAPKAKPEPKPDPEATPARQAEPKPTAKAAPPPPEEAASKAARAKRSKPAEPAQDRTGSLFGGAEAEAQPAPGTPAPAPKAAPKAAGKPGAKPQGEWVRLLAETEFRQAVAAAVERGSASPVLLTRRMGIAYTKAQALIDRMARSGVLGDTGPNGTRPVQITADDLAAALA